VVPEHRRRGIGGRLLEQARATCRDLGATGLVLSVAEVNTAARTLYANCGYRIGSRVMQLDLAQGKPGP
jgi:ribosomal protein S18 acetylase RimI-like enzyme